jgi:aryl-alcohol dehydrogenase
MQMVPFLMREYKKGNLPLSKIVKIYPIEDFEQAIQDMKSGKTIKPVLQWSPT